MRMRHSFMFDVECILFKHRLSKCIWHFLGQCDWNGFICSVHLWSTQQNIDDLILYSFSFFYHQFFIYMLVWKCMDASWIVTHISRLLNSKWKMIHVMTFISHGRVSCLLCTKIHFLQWFIPNNRIEHENIKSHRQSITNNNSKLAPITNDTVFVPESQTQFTNSHNIPSSTMSVDYIFKFLFSSTTVFYDSFRWW